VKVTYSWLKEYTPLAAPAGVTDEAFSRALSATLKVLRRVPGLR